MGDMMLERAAKALDPDAWADGYIPIWPTRARRQEAARQKVRAVIASLREPSEAIVAIGRDRANWLYKDEADETWRAMIGTILQEPKANV